MASKDKVFAKWQEYMEHSEKVEAREQELQRLNE